MCGIGGIINLSGKSVTEMEISSMRDVLIHRGPDDDGVFCNGRIGFAHRRLSIFDLSSAGHQPMFSDCSRYVIVYNGEIYNWPEVRRELRFRNWKSKTDTETVLQAFAERGPACLSLFNGMFGIAIWDFKENCLFLARDRVGIKPLIYGLHQGRLYFASEAKAMFAAGFPMERNEVALFDFLRWGATDHDQNTYFHDIFHVKPGHWMSVADDGWITSDCYWDLAEIVKARQTVSRQDAIRSFDELFRDAVRLCGRSDVPIGCFLSSGVDSTILASVMADEGLSDFSVFTYDFDSGGDGESAGAAEVANLLNVSHEVVTLRSSQVPSLFDQMLWFQEAPVTSIRVIAQFALYKRARDLGRIVQLDGQGGDQVGGGFEYYWMATVLDTLESEGYDAGLRQAQAFLEMYRVPKEQYFPRLIGLLSSVLTPGVCTQDGVPFVKPELLGKGFREAHLERLRSCPRPFRSHYLNAQIIDLMNHNLPRVLRYTDRNGMAWGCEPRPPLLDHRLIELGFCSSADSRTFGTEQRHYMRQVARNILPESILNRPKRSIVDPQRKWLKDELRSWVRDTANSSLLASSGIYDMRALNEELDTFFSIEGTPPTAFHILQMINVSKWLEKTQSPDFFSKQSYSNSKNSAAG